MKITYIHQHFSLPSEGGGSRPYEFARRMVADGHDVTMICSREQGLQDEFSGIKVKRLSIPYRNAMSVPERLWSFARFMISASLVAARTDADVIYASSTPLTVAVPGIVGKIVRRVPMVFEVRDLWPLIPIELGHLNNRFAVWLARKLESIAYSSAHSVVALSPGMRDGVLEVNPDKSVTVIPNACDFELFDQDEEERSLFRKVHGWRDDETVVVYAGGFGPVYELDWVVQLAASVQDYGIRFVLIGEGKNSERLRELSIKLGLDPEELFLGRKPRTEVINYLAASDIVLSSVRKDKCLEAASINKIFDGMAAGRPILVNHEGWLAEAIIEEDAGWQLERDLSSASQRLITIAQNRDALKSSGMNSFALGKKYFDRDDLYRELITVLNIAAGATSGKHPAGPRSL